MNEAFIEVDSTKCVKCGDCIAACPTCVLEMGDAGPRVRDDQCIECGHCVSVCPVDAIDNKRTPRAEQQPFDPAKLPTKEQAALLLRSRRSIRGFEDKPVPRGTVEELLDLARVAPTGGNRQGVRFHVIQDAPRLQAITEAVMDWAEEHQGLAPHLASMVAFHRGSGKDNVLRHAPCLILALMDEATTPMFRRNGQFTLAYAELYAPMLGLGSCWMGLVEAAATSGDLRVLSLLALPKKTIVTGAIAIGVPSYHHRRIPTRHPLKVTWTK